MFALDSIAVQSFPRATVAALFTLLVVSRLAPSQQANASNTDDSDEYKISVESGLVVLPVTVTNHKGEFVPNLAASDFRVYEAGRPQQITLFEPEDVPVTVGLVVDNSGSMAAKRPEVVAASLGFVQSSNPDDEMFVVNFNQRVSLGLRTSCRSPAICTSFELLSLGSGLSATQPSMMASRQPWSI